jgi:hypothetical protein
MQHARDQFLTGSAFALDQRRRARRCDPPDQRHQLFALLALSDEARSRARDVQLLPQAVILAP